MGDDELAEIRRKRMAELQRQQMDQAGMEEELQRQKQAEAQIHLVLMQILEPEARERLNTIKLTKPEFAKAVEQQLVMLSQSGRLRGRITDDQLKALLQQLVPEKKDYNITRR
ncbi:DNA-binding protein [Methanomicrobium antiquum]|uniref:DNA-binding protein L1994_04035 n=1 Tax=Methanomicrobium antiquum TaxID=487686 RepID=A0AAF0FTB3_9EURY|nr:DNA-binding protein [Methanomicrobium antiquum]MDD3976891.1 DNA-binding protein [Methanomicrobium sp.]WFN37566.1 DNA-binding protein [Methanomicrobium antiquum]